MAKSSQKRSKHTARKLKLGIELVPSPLWRINLRSFLSDARWASLRLAAYKASAFTCAICGIQASFDYDIPVNAHEQWVYEDTTRTSTATLTGISCICRMCHSVHHIGVIRKLVANGQADEKLIESVIGHFCRVNDCDRTEFEKEDNRALEEFQQRSSRKYRIRWGQFRILLAERIKAGDYEFSMGGFDAPPVRRYGPEPWIRRDYLTVRTGPRMVHAVPLFDAKKHKRVSKETPIMTFLPIERDWHDGEKSIARRWVGKTYGQFRMYLSDV